MAEPQEWFAPFHYKEQEQEALPTTRFMADSPQCVEPYTHRQQTKPSSGARKVGCSEAVQVHGTLARSPQIDPEGIPTVQKNRTVHGTSTDDGRAVPGGC